MTPQTHTCGTCGKVGTREHDRFRGMREGRPRCGDCYNKETLKRRREKKRRERATTYDWGW